LVPGFAGAINLIIFSPIVTAFNFAGIEVLTHLSPLMFVILVLNGALSVIADFFLSETVIMTSPLLANIGLSLTIPVSLVLDILLDHKHFGVEYIIGSLLVISGFAFVNLDFRKEHQLELEPETKEVEHFESDYASTGQLAQ
jgi:solute carrier family 35 protein F5